MKGFSSFAGFLTAKFCAKASSAVRMTERYSIKTGAPTGKYADDFKMVIDDGWVAQTLLCVPLAKTLGFQTSLGMA